MTLTDFIDAEQLRSVRQELALLWVLVFGGMLIGFAARLRSIQAVSVPDARRAGFPNRAQCLAAIVFCGGKIVVFGWGWFSLVIEAAGGDHSTMTLLYPAVVIGQLAAIGAWIWFVRSLLPSSPSVTGWVIVCALGLGGIILIHLSLL